MKNHFDSLVFYNKAIALIELNDYKGTHYFIDKKIRLLNHSDDKAIVLCIFGLLCEKLGDSKSAIENLTKAILYEEEYDYSTERSRDIAFNARSNSKYENGDFKGAIEDKRHAREIRAKEIDKIKNGVFFDFQSISSGLLDRLDCEPKYKLLLRASKSKIRKYDLIEDYKNVINNKRKEEVIRKLEKLSNSKYENGDFKGSIKAIRRAERYMY